MTVKMTLKILRLALAGLAFAAGPAWAGKAHEHGVMKLDVAVEGSTL